MIRDVLDRPATHRIAIASVALLLFAGVIAAATHRSDSGVGDARLTTKGRAAVTAVNGDRREVSGTVALHRGETVEALQDTMKIELPDGATVEGRPGVDRTNATRVKISTPVELLAGDLLLTATHGTDLDAGGNRIHLSDGVDGPSALRASRSLAVGAYVYRGAVVFDSAGQTRNVPALRELEVSALGRPPTAPQPLRLHEGDEWDRRFLGDAIDLSKTLEQYSATYTRTLGTTSAGAPGFYTSVLPPLASEGDFSASLLSASPHPPGETLVGAAIATLSRRGPFVDRWNQVFAFRDNGAAWGLVALDQGVASAALLSAMQNAVNTTPFQFALPAPTPPTTVATTPTTAGPVTGPTPTTAPTTPTTTPPPTTTTTIIPPTGSPVIDGLVNNVNKLLGGLTGN